MKVALLDHQGKGRMIGDVLVRNGFEIADDVGTWDYDLVIVDSNHPQSPPAPYKYLYLQEVAKRQIPIVLFPHGGPPDLDWDGLRRIELRTSLQLLHGEGHAEVNRRIGVKHRFEVVGWMFSETAVRLTATTPVVSRLLFAPIHPHANGITILDEHAGANRAAYHEFLAYPCEHKTVRMFGQDAPNGIYERVEDVTYTQTNWSAGLDVIQAHDAVISFGTMAYNALAMGKPTAFIYPYPGFRDDHGNLTARHWGDYSDYVRYPASLGYGTLDELFSRDVTEWTDLFIGGPLDEEKLCGLLRQYKMNRQQRRQLARTR